MHHLLWPIMCILSCNWKPGYSVWCLLSFGYQNAFHIASIMFLIELKKIVCSGKNRIFRFVADAQG
jgi:hypothetical protein